MKMFFRLFRSLNPAHFVNGLNAAAMRYWKMQRLRRINGKDRKQQPTRVLVVGARGIPNIEGGAEKNAEMLFPDIASRNFRVVLIGLEKYLKRHKFRGVELQPAPYVKILGTDKLAYYLFALSYALRYRPHIVHFQGLGSALFLILYRLAGCQTVVRYGSADYILDKWGLVGKLGFLLCEWQLRFAHKVIAVTPALQERLSKRGIKKNVVVIGNGLDDSKRIHPLPENQSILSSFGLERRNYILSVGRVTGQKNFDRLIQAFRKLPPRVRRDTKLVIVGGFDDEKYYEYVQKQITPNIEPYVVLTGRLNRNVLPVLYKNCSFFVNASIHEGRSNATLEAISNNCPVILSDIAENMDLGLPDHHLFDPYDVYNIKYALESCLLNPDDYFADKTLFPSWSVVAQQTVSVYMDKMANANDSSVLQPVRRAS